MNKAWRIAGFIFWIAGTAAGTAHGAETMDQPKSSETKLEKATFAGGCFWCMQPPFRKLSGVHSVVSGYTGGTKKDPAYEEVSEGVTGHAEAVEIFYDPSKVSYEELLDVFWRNIDPTQANGQFADRGPQYRTAIFYHTEEQKRLAEISKKELARSGKFLKALVTAVQPASDFYPAEEYHQDYDKKNPLHYKGYRKGSGREDFLEKTWGKGSASKEA